MAMDLNAKAAYIRGMMKGMEFDPTTQEGKIIVAMMDLLEEMADVVSEHDDALDQAFDELDAIDEDMDDLVDNIFGDDDEDEDEDEDDDGAFETSYEVTCPNCGTVNIVDEDTLMDSDKIVCAECGAAFDVEVLPDDAEMPADAEAARRELCGVALSAQNRITDRKSPLWPDYSGRRGDFLIIGEESNLQRGCKRCHKPVDDV